MQPWHEFIESQDLAKPVCTAAVCPVTQHGLLYVGGDDAQNFLQNQLSNDIGQVDSKHAQISSFSNAKGRMLAIFRVIAIEGGYLLLMPREIIDQVQSQLQRYVLRSQVVLADVSDSFGLLTVSSFDLAADPRFCAEVNGVFQSDSLITLRLNDSVDGPRYLAISNDPAELVELWQTLTESCKACDESTWRLQEVRAGVPTLYQDTMGAFVLQMTNLQQLDGVNFKKGCYPGQEVVARMQYLGKLKRRMYRATLNSGHCPSPGDELRERGGAESASSGKVVDAIPVAHGQSELLLVGRIDQAEAGSLVLSDQPDATLELQQLPYDLPQ